MCTAGDLARAFLYAVDHGWIPAGDLGDGSPAISMPDEFGPQKLRARRAFLALLHETEIEAEDVLAVVEAICAAPREWRVFPSTQYAVAEIMRRVRHHLTAEQTMALIDAVDLANEGAR
jgi:hypothetical protein